MTPLQTILVALDFSTGSRAALEQASRLAQHHGAALHVLHVIDSHVLALKAESRGESFESAAHFSTTGGRKTLESWLAQSNRPAGHTVTLIIGVPLRQNV